MRALRTVRGRLALAAASLLLAGGGFVAVHAATDGPAGVDVATAGQAAEPAPVEDAQDRALLSAVQDASGAPLPGRDPSAQTQTSWEDAVNRPHPVALVAGSPPGKDAAPSVPAEPDTSQEDAHAGHSAEEHAAHAGPSADEHAAHAEHGTPVPAPEPKPVSDPASVLGDPATTGVLSSGCAVGYGRVDQCVPARAPGGAVTTCAYVLTVFPNGLPVTGRDPLNLDGDRDGTACGPGDRGVPTR